MTLAEIRATYPDLFYAQEWFKAEPFMDTVAVQLPPLLAWSYDYEPRLPVTAADLASAYVRDPMASIWRLFLWTDDHDSHGNRVYVGGVGVYGIQSFQIHRHLTPTCYYVKPA